MIPGGVIPIAHRRPVQGKHRANTDTLTVESDHQPRHKLEVFVVRWNSRAGVQQHVITEGETNADRVARSIALHDGSTDVVYFRAPEVW